MPILKDRELFASIKKGQLFNIYYLCGKERYFLNEAVKRIKAQTLKDSDESFNLTVFDDEKINLSKAYDAVEALPVFAEKKCVILKGIALSKLTVSDSDRLLDIINTLPDTTVLVIIPLEEDGKKLSSKAKKIADAATKAGAFCEFEYLSQKVLASELSKKVESLNSTLSTDNAEFLIDRCGLEYGRLLSEIKKLASFRPGGIITQDDIIKCCVESLDSSAFDISKSIMKRDFAKALSTLSNLFEQRVEPTMIIGALSSVFSDLYRAKCAISQGKKSSDLIKDFNYPKYKEKGFYYTFKDAASVSEDLIASYVNAILEADMLLKSTSLEPQFLLQEMLFKMQSAALTKGR